MHKAHLQQQQQQQHRLAQLQLQWMHRASRAAWLLSA
jgi:hypothetical protein